MPWISERTEHTCRMPKFGRRDGRTWQCPKCGQCYKLIRRSGLADLTIDHWDPSVGHHEGES